MNFPNNEDCFLDKSIKALDVVGDFDECPHCKTSFIGKDIYEHFLEQYKNDPNYPYLRTKEDILESIRIYPDLYAGLSVDDINNSSFFEMNALYTARSYGWTKENPKSFKHTIVGVEVQGVYDGVLFWHCSKCNTYWKRFPWSDLSIIEGWKEKDE